VRLGPRALTSLLAVSGPVTVPGLDEPLDVSNAFEFFTRDQYDDAFTGNDARIDFLGRVVERVVRTLTATSLTDPRAFGTAFSDAIAAGDVAVWSADADEQAVLAAVRLSGGAAPADDGDTLFVTQHNLLPNKIDSWSRRHVTYDVDVDDTTGTIAGTVSVALTNDAPASAPEYLVGTGSTGLRVGMMRELITIYSPHELSNFRIDGEPVEVLLQEELGRHAYQVRVEVARGEQATITADVAGSVALPYRLTMPVIPAVNFDTATVTIDDRDPIEWTLDRTRTVTP